MSAPKTKKKYVRPEVREHAPLIGLTLQSQVCDPVNDPNCTTGAT
jgi:hypothetical protein